MSMIVAPKILLPIKSIDMGKWSVIACDQFTSQPEYWEKVKAMVDNIPSTYHLILPEAYLEEDMDYMTNEVNNKMSLYLKNRIFEEFVGFILVERKTPFVKRRLGLVLAIDLEEYQYEPGKTGKIRATEKTVPERIPPRVRIRENAPLELPHVLVLADDSNDRIINELYENRKNLKPMYNFELNMGGGHVKGFGIEDTSQIIDRFERMSKDIGLIVGDGNHSLAAAKVCWENLKKTLPVSEHATHPARFALVELISLYDEGLTFEPIHRIIFKAKPSLVEGLKALLDGDGEVELIHGDKVETLKTPDNPFETIKIIQNYLDEYLEKHPESEIDFIHGLEHTKSIVEKSEGAIGITMPPLKRDLLLPYIRENGVLPRKSFSLGEAEEKRYYLEGKIIR